MSWRDQIEDLDDEELRRFIYNLCDYHNGKGVQLITKADRLVWKGILPALVSNEAKYNERIEKNQRNGRLGGRPKISEMSKNQENPEKPIGSFENPKNPINDNWILDTGKGKLEIENGELKKEEREKKSEKSELKFEKSELDLASSMLLDKRKQIPGTRFFVEDNPPGFFQAMVGSSLSKYKGWRIEIYELPLEEFIEKAKQNISNELQKSTDYLIDLIKGYLFYFPDQVPES